MGAHISNSSAKSLEISQKRNVSKRIKKKKKKREKNSLPIWNNIDNVTILHPVSSRFSSVFNDHDSKRWSRLEKNITILFRQDSLSRGEINRSLMRRRFSPTCNPHFVQPNFPYFSLFSFLFSSFLFFSFFFYLSIVLVHLIPNRSRLPPRRVTSAQTTRKRGPRSASSVECALVAEIECSFPVLAGIEVVNRPICFVDPILLRSGTIRHQGEFLLVVTDRW